MKVSGMSEVQYNPATSKTVENGVKQNFFAGQSGSLGELKQENGRFDEVRVRCLEETEKRLEEITYVSAASKGLKTEPCEGVKKMTNVLNALEQHKEVVARGIQKACAAGLKGDQINSVIREEAEAWVKDLMKNDLKTFAGWMNVAKLEIQAGRPEKFYLPSDFTMEDYARYEPLIWDCE